MEATTELRKTLVREAKIQSHLKPGPLEDLPIEQEGEQVLLYRGDLYNSHVDLSTTQA